MAKRKRTEEQNKKLIEQTKATRIKKGEVRNPYGQPRRLPSLDKILIHVFGVDGDQEDDKSKITEIMEAMYKEGKKGNTQAAHLVLDRLVGKVKQTNVVINGGMSKEDVGALFPFAPPTDKE